MPSKAKARRWTRQVADDEAGLPRQPSNDPVLDARRHYAGNAGNTEGYLGLAAVTQGAGRTRNLIQTPNGVAHGDWQLDENGGVVVAEPLKPRRFGRGQGK